jgi:phytoene synthase
MSEREHATCPARVTAHCQAMIEAGSKSFAWAARLFDPDTRRDAYLLYAWCRYCDDQIDAEHLGYRVTALDDAERAARLLALERQTQAALAGQPGDEPVFQALHSVVTRRGIPERYPLELLTGFAMDVRRQRCERLDDLLLYCYHVAGVVGLMMAHVMGTRDPRALQRAADLGIALQLTNVARDVLDDARVQRVYLPLDWLAQAGVPVEQLAEPAHRAALFGVVARLLDEAERYYVSGDQGLPSLSFRSAWAVAMARGVYRDIGRLVRRRGPHAWERRAVVSPVAKLGRLGTAFFDALHARSLGRRRPVRPRADLWRKERSGVD